MYLRKRKKGGLKWLKWYSGLDSQRFRFWYDLPKSTCMSFLVSKSTGENIILLLNREYM